MTHDTGDRATIIALTATVFVTVLDHPIDVTPKDTHSYHPADPPLINMMKTSVRASVSGTVSGGTVKRGKRRLEVSRGVANEQ
jgi:hypothetical protein